MLARCLQRVAVPGLHGAADVAADTSYGKFTCVMLTVVEILQNNNNKKNPKTTTDLEHVVPPSCHMMAFNLKMTT